MWQIILKGLAAGFAAVIVAEIATRYPRLGALILTIPLLPAGVLLLVYLKANNLAPVCTMSREMLVLIPLGLPVFVPLALAPRLNLSFWPAFVTGLLMVVVTISVYLRFTTRTP